MRVLMTAASLALALTFFTAPSAVAEEKKKSCFRVYDITGFQYIDNEYLLLNGRTASRKYLVSFRRQCSDLRFTNGLTTSFANSLVCPPFNEYVRTGSDRCPVKKIKALSAKDDHMQIISKWKEQEKEETAVPEKPLP